MIIIDDLEVSQHKLTTENDKSDILESTPQLFKNIKDFGSQGRISDFEPRLSINKARLSSGFYNNFD
jgi:hypothetical protein